jgi:hypothetical protein
MRIGAFIRLPKRWTLFATKPSNKSLDASGGGVFRNLLGAAQGALIRAAASTPPLGVI